MCTRCVSTPWCSILSVYTLQHCGYLKLNCVCSTQALQQRHDLLPELWFYGNTTAGNFISKMNANTITTTATKPAKKTCSQRTNKICDKMVGNRKTDVCSLEFILLNYNGKLWCLMYVKWGHSSERYRVIVKVHW